MFVPQNERISNKLLKYENKNDEKRKKHKTEGREYYLEQEQDGLTFTYSNHNSLADIGNAYVKNSFPQ